MHCPLRQLLVYSLAVEPNICLCTVQCANYYYRLNHWFIYVLPVKSIVCICYPLDWFFLCNTVVPNICLFTSGWTKYLSTLGVEPNICLFTSGWTKYLSTLGVEPNICLFTSGWTKYLSTLGVELNTCLFTSGWTKYLSIYYRFNQILVYSLAVEPNTCLYTIGWTKYLPIH